MENTDDVLPTVEDSSNEEMDTNQSVILEYKDLKWVDEDHTYLNMMINHKDYGYIPYTASAEDTGIGKQVWDIKDTLEIAEYEPPIKNLEDLKIQKLNELSAKSSQFEQTENKDMVVTSSLGFRINADPKAKRNIDTLIELEVSTFRDYDNEIHPDMTLEDLGVIKREISMNAVNLYNQKWKMETEINSLESVEEVENYQIVFEMLDFSN